MDDVILENTMQQKRKIKNQAEWKREKRKRLIIAGQSHYSVKGELVPHKEIGPDCKCKLKCYEKVDSGMRQMLFAGFYSLKSYDEQNAYLFGLIRKHDVKRKKNIHSDRRTCTYKYYVRNQGREIQVCKIAFAHIHAVSFRKIRTLSEKLDQNVLFPRDGRGKHDNRPTKTPTETLDLIRKHIIHVIKKGELKQFVKEDKNNVMTPELNVAKLYLHFLQTYEQKAIDVLTGQLNPGFSPKVKSWLYRKVFHQEVQCISLHLKRKLDAATGKNTVVQDGIQVVETEISRNRFPVHNEKLHQKDIVSIQTFSSHGQSDPKCDFLPDKDFQAQSGNSVTISNVHFMTANNKSTDTTYKDADQSCVKISQHVSNCMNLSEFKDLLNKEPNKLQSVYLGPEKQGETCANSPVIFNISIDDSVNTSSISIQPFIENVPIHDSRYRHAGLFENMIELNSSSKDTSDEEILSSLSNTHVYCS